MKNFIIIATFIVIAVVTIVGWNNSKAPVNANSVNKLKIPPTQGECLTADGTWSQFGLISSLRCLLTTKDGGNACTDSSQCQGECVSADNGASGQCSPKIPVTGCVTIMKNGRGSSVCFD